MIHALDISGRASAFAAPAAGCASKTMMTIITTPLRGTGRTRAT
jgi:hypothetical protein